MSRVMPLVSIVTPVYNGSKYIEELILSVREQAYDRIEHIVIDDGSVDGGATVQILRRHKHLRWWTRPNQGAYATMNEGMAAASGHVVTLVCADDKYAGAQAILEAMELWTSGAPCEAVYGITNFIDESGAAHDSRAPLSGPLWMFQYFPIVSHCSLFVAKKTITGKQMWFDLSYPLKADYDWIMRLILSGCRFKRLRRTIASHRVHGDQRSRTAARAAHGEESERLTRVYGKGSRLVRCFVELWWRWITVRHRIQRRGTADTLRFVRDRITRSMLRGLSTSERP